MAQLVVTIDDSKLIPDLKKAIKMLKGVSNISVNKNVSEANKKTLEAIRAAQNGNTIKCDSFEDYLKKVMQ